MRIAYCNRPNYDNPLGGDAVQMLKTKQFIESAYNVEIEIVTNPGELDVSFDIVHVFNFVPSFVAKGFIERTKKLNLPLVCSPIFWNYFYVSNLWLRKFYIPPYLSLWQTKLEVTLLKLVARLVGKPDFLSKRFRMSLGDFIEKADIILPNSPEEAELLLQFVGCNNDENRKKVRIANNACDITVSLSYDKEEQFLKKYNIPKDYVLQVGRIEVIKNQLNLLNALKNNPEIPIVFVGKKVDPRYFKVLSRIAKKRGRVFFIDHVQHEDLTAFYRYAKVHCLLSLRESPGLVSIEALANKCPIVVSDRRFLPLDYYFPSQKYIADPFNLLDIKQVVMKAYTERIVCSIDTEKFSWQYTAKQTFSAYKELLERSQKV